LDGGFCRKVPEDRDIYGVQGELMFNKHITDEELTGTSENRSFGCIADNSTFRRQRVESPWTAGASTKIAPQQSCTSEFQQPNVRSRRRAEMPQMFDLFPIDDSTNRNLLQKLPVARLNK
jgi:hypothetical protein